MEEGFSGCHRAVPVPVRTGMRRLNLGIYIHVRVGRAGSGRVWSGGVCVLLGGGELIPENDLAFAFPVAVGVVGALMPLGVYRRKMGDWASCASASSLADDKGGGKSPLKDNLGFLHLTMDVLLPSRPASNDIRMTGTRDCVCLCRRRGRR